MKPIESLSHDSKRHVANIDAYHDESFSASNELCRLRKDISDATDARENHHVIDGHDINCDRVQKTRDA